MVLPENELQEVSAHFGVRERACGEASEFVWPWLCGRNVLCSSSVALSLTLCSAPSTPPKLGTGEALLETLPVGNTLWLGGCFTLKSPHQDGVDSGLLWAPLPISMPMPQIPAVSPMCESGLLAEAIWGLCLDFGVRFLHAEDWRWE